MRSVQFVMILASALALTGCEGADRATTQGGDAAAAAETIRKVEADWMKKVGGNRPDEMRAYYTPDAVVMQAGAKPLKGRDQIIAAAQALGQDPNFRLTFQSEKIEVSGDLAYSRGTYQLQMTDPETKKPATGTGEYLTVYQRQPDGSWKALEGIST